MSTLLKSTLGNYDWLTKNEAALKRVLPETWTHIENLNGLQMGFNLKLIGVDWRNEEELSQVMIFLEKVGLMQRQNGYQVRSNPKQVFL
jgi:hypothetical protein